MLYDFRIDLQDGFPDWVALELIFSGCQRGLQGNPCPGCHNPELWEFKPSPANIQNRLQKICENYRREDIFLDGIVCVGGEPLDQSDLYQSIDLIKNIMNIPVFIYTGYTLDQIKELEGTDQFPRCDYLKIGPYDPSCPPRAKSKLASGNQAVFKVDGLYLSDEISF